MKHYYGSISYPTLKRDINITLQRVKRWYQTRGAVTTADTVKLCRLCVTRFLAGSPILGPCRTALTSDGLPKLIPHKLREIVRSGDPRGISLVLTLLSVTRMIQGGKPVDIAAIEDKSEYDLTKVRKYIIPFLLKHGIKPIDTTWQAYHWSTKMGPTGPALVAALGSYRNLPKELKDDLITIGGPAIERMFSIYDSWSKDIWDVLLKIFPSRDSSLFRKLSVKRDREAKSRVFAILDYYSQTVLRPIHLGLFQGLKKIPADRTFVQAEGMTFDPSSDSYHSLDLSSATDRFPMQLQKELLSVLIGPEKAEAWARILTKWPYDLNGKPVYYNTGQPMGAYSSWSAFTMTHHLVVFAASQRAGKPASWSNYALLGDDIVIADESVANEYRLILKDLNVPISEQKSHVSKDTWEFAKRWFHKGQEVTPFPLAGLMEVAKKYYLLLELLRSVELRGFGKATFSFRKPSPLPSLLRIFGYRGRLISSYIRKFSLTACIPLPGTIDSEVYDSLIRFVQLAGISLSCNLRVASAVQLFERFAAQAATWMMARESEKIVVRSMSWRDATADAIIDLPMEPVDQAELLDASPANPLPVISSLEVKLQGALDSISDAAGADYSDDRIWDILPKLRLLNMPDVKGVIPSRSSHEIAGSRATWAVSLARLWKRHEQGKRP